MMQVEDLSGQTVKGYQLIRVIGQGRFGMIYHATQPQIGRDVAVKVISSEVANDPDFVRRFETEAQLVARLEHIHIVPLYDYWREPDRAFLVMRWLPHGSIRDSLVQHGPWPVGATARLLDQIASALAVAHRKDVLHRDIKPDNILLDEDSNALLTDFGIAASTADLKSSAPPQRMVGTPAYMAPELFMGEPASRQSDIYSLGVLIFEVLTNTRPFPDRTTEQAMHHHLSSPVPSLQSTGLALPTELNLVIWRATAKSPQARYASVSDLAGAFRSSASAALGLDIIRSTDLPVALPGSPTEEVVTMVIEPPLPPDNPYKGLRPFEQADAADFFGREVLVARLLERLTGPSLSQGFLALVGPSGSGKSSAVKAGLIPALRRGALPDSDRWFAVEMVPGSDPFRALELALQRVAVNPITDTFKKLIDGDLSLLKVVERILPGDARSRLVLLIDQFEEVFTQVESEPERQRFLELLGAAVAGMSNRLLLIITLRADYYDRPLLYEGFGALMRECTEVILPLTVQELQAAILGPADRIGLTLEPELVAAIIADVNQQPGALPLLQYALTEVFERRAGPCLTLDAYRVIGGIAGALTRRADDVYNQLAADRQDLTRQLFLRLTGLDEDDEATRRRLNWSDVTSLTDDIQAVVDIRDAFVKYRLLTTDRDPKTREPTIEVAHEALLRGWDRLIAWIDASREDIQMQRRLQALVAEWDKSSRDEGYLLSGSRLSQFEEWLVSSQLQLTQDERAFLQASAAARAARQAREAARLTREKTLERRTRNWLVIMVLVLAVGALVAMLMAQIALDQQDVAEDRLNRLRIMSRADQVNVALDDNNPELALALAYTLPDNRESFPLPVRQMFYRVAYTPGVRLIFDRHNAPVLSIALSPDGTLVASGSGRLNPLGAKAGGRVRVWNPATGEEIRVLEGHDDSVTGLAFSPDGQRLASSSIDRTIILWDLNTGTPLHRLEGHDDWVNRVAFTPDGKTLLSASGNFFVTIIPVPGLGTQDASVRAWDVETGAEIRRFDAGSEGHQGPVMSLAISPDGDFAVTGDTNGVIMVWNISTGEAIRRMESRGDWVSSLVIVPDGSLVVAGLGKPSIASSGATTTLAAVWDIQTGERVRDLAGHTNVVTAVAVSADGRSVLTGSADFSVRLWDLASGQELQRFVGHSDWVFGVVFGPDGQWAVSAATDATARVWELAPGNLVQRFDTALLPPLYAADLSKDGRTAITGHGDGLVVVWDVATGRIIHRLGEGVTSHRAAVYTVALSPDSDLAASGDQSGHVTLWDLNTGAELRHFEGHNQSVWTVVFSPDGRWILTASGEPQQIETSEDNTVRVWDVITGQELHRFEGHEHTVWAAVFSPDGRQIASSSGSLLSDGNSSIRVWDISTSSEIVRFDGHDDVVSSLAFSPDGDFILSGSNDSTARLWNIQTRDEVRRFEGHSGFIDDVVFNADGQTVITGSDDNTIRLWDALTGDEWYRIEGHDDTIQDLSLSADGRLLLALSTDNDLRLWRVDRNLDELAAWIALHRTVRDLTCTERITYRIEPYCD